VDVRLFLSRCELTGPCPAGQGAAFVGGLVAFLCRSLLGEGTRVWSVNMYDRIIFDIPSCHCKVTCPNLHLEKIVVQYSFFCCFFLSGWFYMIFIDIILCLMRHDQVDLQKPVKSIPQLSNWLFIPLGWSLTKSHRWRRNQSSTSGDQCAAQIISNLFTSMLFVHRTRHIWSSHMVSSYRMVLVCTYCIILYYGIHMVFHICIYSITCIGAASWSAIHPRSRWFYPAPWHRMAREATS
jgi:hypothetical protein